MKKLTIILILLVSTVMFSTPSYAEWTKVTKDMSGNTYYVDFERIRKNGGYVFYWVLLNYLKPTLGGLSLSVYRQGDCKNFRHQTLRTNLYKKPMGIEFMATANNAKNPEWDYPAPNTVNENILKKVCSR